MILIKAVEMFIDFDPRSKQLRAHFQFLQKIENSNEGRALMILEIIFKNIYLLNLIHSRYSLYFQASYAQIQSQILVRCRKLTTN